MTQQLRLGIIGCGTVFQVCHAPSLALLPEHFRVTAVCDVSARARDAIGARLGVERRYAAAEELVRQAEIDAVLVTVPHAYHTPVVLAALAAGKHVLVEKPMCMTLREADEIIAAQEASGLVVQVGTMRRYAPAFIEATRLVREMGEIRLARVYDILGRNALIVDQTTHVVRGDDVAAEVVAAGRALEARLIDEAIGAAPPELQAAYRLMLGLSTHDTSAMRELLGRPRRLLYAAQRYGGRYLTAAFDYGDYICHFETGADEIPRFDGSLTVLGADRTVRVEYDTPYVRHLPIRLIVTAANGVGGVSQQVIQPNWGDPFIDEWLAFHTNVLARRPAKTSPADYREDLELYAEMISAMRTSA